MNYELTSFDRSCFVPLPHEEAPQLEGHTVTPFIQFFHNHFEGLHMSYAWTEPVEALVSDILQALPSNNTVSLDDAPPIEGCDMKAYLVGSCARAFPWPPGNYFAGAHQRQALRQRVMPRADLSAFLDQLNHPVYRTIAEGAAYDLDLRVPLNPDVNCHTVLESISKQLLIHFNSQMHIDPPFMKDGVHQYLHYIFDRPWDELAILSIKTEELSNGKFIIMFTYKSGREGEPEFSIHISNYEPNLKSDTRMGPQQCNRQRYAIVPLYVRQNPIFYPDNSSYLVIEQNKYHHLQTLWHSPESIEKVEYESLEQALVVGLRMIWSLMNWPPSTDASCPKEYLWRYIDQRTVMLYRAELGRLIELPEEGQSIGERRALEIDTLSILCADKDPELFLQLATALGIMKCYKPKNTFFTSTDDDVIAKSRKIAQWISTFTEQVNPNDYSRFGSTMVARLLMNSFHLDRVTVQAITKNTSIPSPAEVIQAFLPKTGIPPMVQ